MTEEEKENIGLAVIAVSAIITVTAVFASIGDYINNERRNRYKND